jgi:type IV secretion system protein VirD4
VTDNPNFNPVQFVFGRRREKDEGQVVEFDTLYINSSGLSQQQLAPLIVALLTEIKEARYQIDRMAKTRGIYHPPTVFTLDETANIAPIPDLPTIVSQGGSQGVVVAAVFQHLGQAKPRWDKTVRGS